MMGDFDFLLSCFFNPSKFSATDKECDFKNSLSKTISKVEYGIICNIKKRVQFVSQTHNVFGPNGEVSEQLLVGPKSHGISCDMGTLATCLLSTFS